MFQGTPSAKEEQPDGGSGFTLILHWNGTSWSRVPSPNPSTSNNVFYSISPVTASDIWAVGSSTDDASSMARPLIAHWDGAHWTQVTGATPGISSGLNGVAVVSSNDVWAVGAYVPANSQVQHTLVEHWNGTAWTQVTSPNFGSYSNYLLAVSAISDHDLWAVGSYQDSGSNAHTLALHWNGTNWTQVNTPNPGSYENILGGVAALASNDVWAVGRRHDQAGAGRTLIEHWDGTIWSVANSANATSYENTLNSITTAGSNGYWL